MLWEKQKGLSTRGLTMAVLAAPAALVGLPLVGLVGPSIYRGVKNHVKNCIKGKLTDIRGSISKMVW